VREVTFLLQRYRVAVAASLVAFLIMLLLPARSERLPFAVFIGAVAVSAWHGGHRPGLVATGLSALALVFKWLVFPSGSSGSDPDFWSRLATFGLIGLLASYLSRMCQRAVAQVEWINNAFACIADAVIFTDADGHVTYLNAAAESLVGWSLSEADGRPLDRVFPLAHEETRQPGESAAAQILRTGAVASPASDAVLAARTGEVRTIEQRAALLRDARGDTVGTILLFRDVTEVRRVERERRQTAEALSEATSAEHDRLSQALQESQRRIEADEAERGRTEAALRESRGRYDGSEAERRRLETVLSESQTQVQAALKEQERLQEEIDASQKRVENAEDERDRLRAELQQSQARIQAVETNQRQAEEALRQAELESQELASRHATELEQAAALAQAQLEERQRTIDALRENQARLQTVFDNTTAALYLKDAEGRFLLVNHAFKNLFQLGKKQVVERTDQDLFPPEFAEVLRADDRQAFAVRGPLELEETLHSESMPRTLLSLRVPLYDAEGRATGLCGVAVDVSAYKRFERELSECEGRARESTEQLRQVEKEAQASAERLREQLQFVRSITTSLGDGVCAVNRFGGLTFINPAAERLLGWQESDLLGQDFRDTVHPPHADDSYLSGGDGFLAAVIEERTTVRHEDEIFARKDGSPLAVACTAAPLMSDGEVAGAVFSFHERTLRQTAARPETPHVDEADAAPAEPGLLPPERAAGAQPVQVEPTDWLSYN
jgi:PAS domain S-box-containing protein